ncbi:MAG: dienelactone hydrolase family protein [Hyphomonadaceae bacterium]|nr:dienelactone hydrolase family protein [Hyphomonadaceae bacterium]
MIETTIDIATRDGACTTFIAHPDRHGPHPAVLFYMDAPAIREELRDMARRLASAGYYVMLPNLYYRAGVLELGPPDRAPGSPWLTRMIGLMNDLTIPMIMSDTEAFIAHIDADPAAKPGPMGTMGYCMSGQYAVSAAAAFPDRISAAASLYGVALVTDAEASPHLSARKARAEIYAACAETDAFAPPEMVQALAADFAAHGVLGEVEVYPGTQHGFAFPQRPQYHKAAAERHWTRLHALFRRRL